MKPNLARVLTSLILDQWPLPRWVRRRIESNRDVAREIDRASRLEDQLRGQSTALPGTPHRHVQLSARRSTSGVKVATIVIAATAASVLACAVLLSMGDRGALRQTTGLPKKPTDVAELDTDAVLASLAAGQTIVSRISAGVQNIAVKISNATSEASSSSPIRFLQDVSSEG